MYGAQDIRSTAPCPATSPEDHPCLSVKLLRADVKTGDFENGSVCSPSLHLTLLTAPMKLGWAHACAARQRPRLIRNIRRSGATVRESGTLWGAALFAGPADAALCQMPITWTDIASAPRGHAWPRMASHGLAWRRASPSRPPPQILSHRCGRAGSKARALFVSRPFRICAM